MSAQDALEMKAASSTRLLSEFFDPFLAVVTAGSVMWIVGLTWAAHFIF